MRPTGNSDISGPTSSISSHSIWPVGVAVGFATLLRFTSLNRNSLWLDEAATWWNATRPSWLVTAFAETNHAPLWWLVTRAFVLPFGSSEFVLRAPAVIAGISCVWLAWLLTRRLLDPARAPDAAGFRGLDAGAPLAVAFLTAIHPFWIEYSQEARMYAALLAGSLGLSILYLDWLRERRTRSLVLYALVGAVTLYTHHFAALAMAPHAVFAIGERVIRRGPKAMPSAWPLLTAQVAALVLFFPWLLRTLRSGASAATLGSFGPLQRLGFALWRLLYGPSLATLDRPRVDAGPIAMFRQEAIVLAMGGAIAAVALALGLRALRRDPLARDFIVVAIIVPIGALLAVFSRLPLLHEKFLIMTAPFLLILTVVGARKARGLLRPALVIGLFGFTAIGTVAFFAPGAPIIARWIVHGHPYGKEDWRSAHTWVAERAGQHDVVLLYPGYLHMAWEYYDRGRLSAVSLSFPPTSAAALASGTGAWNTGARLFLVTAGVRAAVRESLVKDLLRWANGSGGPRDSLGPMDAHLFPQQWGVWTYEFGGVAASDPLSR